MTAQHDIHARLTQFLDTVRDKESRQVGYPANQDFDYSPSSHSWATPSTTSVTPSTGPTTGPTPTSSNGRSSSTSPTSPDWTPPTPGATSLGRHRGQHLRPLPGPGTPPRRDALLLRGGPLLHPQDRPGPEHAPHHRQETGRRGDRLPGPQGNARRPPGPARRHPGHRRHHHAGRSGRYPQDTEHPGQTGRRSISISGHKLIGAPLPCGIVLTRRHLVETLGRAVELVGVNDTTLSGSRNGLTPPDDLVCHKPPRRGPMEGDRPGHAGHCRLRRGAVQSWTLRILSGISEGICNTMVQSGGEFLYIGVGGR